MCDDMSPEEGIAEYLRTHPAYEMSLWMEWVVVVCDRLKIATPTGREWDTLQANFTHGKMPITSVDELIALRKTSAE